MKEGNFSRFFCKLSKASICVVGDFMVDAYTEGVIDRISPEAPVSVLHAKSHSFRPGGAGNVVLNLLSLGAEAFAVGRLGEDQRGEDLKGSLEEKGTNVEGLFYQEGYPTTVKNRLIADNQQILRIDHEENLPLDNLIEAKVISYLNKKIDSIDVIAISDYAKGFLTTTLLEKIIKLARKKNCPVVVDPKGLSFSRYRFCNLIKPNEKEAYLAANLSKDHSLDEVAKVLLEDTQAENLVITRSSKGISFFNNKGYRKDFPVHSKEVVDVTGAGDTVLAALAISMANNFSLEEGVFLANICGGRAIQKMGCCQVTLSEVATSLLKRDTNNKIFEETHLFALKHLLNAKEVILFEMDVRVEFSLSHYKMIKKHAQKDIELIVSLRGEDTDYLDLLSSLKEIDFIILTKSKEGSLIEEIKPKKTISLIDHKAFSSSLS